MIVIIFPGMSLKIMVQSIWSGIIHRVAPLHARDIPPWFTHKYTPSPWSEGPRPPTRKAIITFLTSLPLWVPRPSSCPKPPTPPPFSLSLSPPHTLFLPEAMARNKVKLAWIANDATRRATLKKRRKGLLKKVQELSILCGVEACAIVYGPNDRVPEVWPSPPEAARIIGRFKSMPEMEQTRKMVNQEGFLRQRAVKLLEQLRKQERENREIEMKLLIREGLKGQSFDNLGIEEATCLSWMLERKIKEIYDTMDEVRNKVVVNQAAAGPSALPPPVMAPPPPPLPPLPPAAAAAPTGPIVPREKTPVEQAMEALQRQNWFVDMMSPWPEDFYQAAQPMDPYQPPPPAPVDHSSPWPDPSIFPFN